MEKKKNEGRARQMEGYRWSVEVFLFVGATVWDFAYLLVFALPPLQ